MEKTIVRRGEQHTPQVVPPYDLEAEQAVLGAMLVDADALAMAAQELRRDDFFSERHRLIFTAAVEMQPAPVDIVTLAAELKRRNANWYDDVGGYPYLQQMAVNVPTTANTGAYIEILHRLSLQRTVLTQAYSMIDAAPTLTAADVSDLLGSLELAFHDRGAVKREPRFVAVKACDLAPAGDQCWLIEHLIPVNGTVGLVGPPGKGKSFLALSAALCIATGQPWMGRPVKAGNVLYVCMEGQEFIKKRVDAWREAHGRPTADRAFFMSTPLSLLDAADVTQFIDDLRKQAIEPGLVIFDTLSRVMPGDENDAETMNLVVRSVDRIRADTGAAVMLVHHTTKANSREPRGSSVFKGVLDVMAALDCDERSPAKRCATWHPGRACALACTR